MNDVENKEMNQRLLACFFPLLKRTCNLFFFSVNQQKIIHKKCSENSFHLSDTFTVRQTKQPTSQMLRTVFSASSSSLFWNSLPYINTARHKKKLLS